MTLRRKPVAKIRIMTSALDNLKRQQHTLACEWFWFVLTSRNGQVRATSEMYTSAAHARRAARDCCRDFGIDPERVVDETL